MAKYRKYDWPCLIKEFKESGLKQTEFCEQQGINPKYFSQKLKQVNNNQFAKVEVQPVMQSNGLVLEVGRCKVICPADMSLSSFAALARALA